MIENKAIVFVNVPSRNTIRKQNYDVNVLVMSMF